MNNLRKISSLLLLAFYGLIMSHSLVPHNHSSHSEDIAVDHHHEKHGHSHDHQHGTEESESVFDWIVAFFSFHSQQFDSATTHFQELKPSNAKVFSAADIQLHLCTIFEDHHGPPGEISDTIEPHKVFFLFDYYSTFHSLRAPPSLG